MPPPQPLPTPTPPATPAPLGAGPTPPPNLTPPGLSPQGSQLGRGLAGVGPGTFTPPQTPTVPPLGGNAPIADEVARQYAPGAHRSYFSGMSAGAGPLAAQPTPQAPVAPATPAAAVQQQVAQAPPAAPQGPDGLGTGQSRPNAWTALGEWKDTAKDLLGQQIGGLRWPDLRPANLDPGYAQNSNRMPNNVHVPLLPQSPVLPHVTPEPGSPVTIADGAGLAMLGAGRLAQAGRAGLSRLGTMFGRQAPAAAAGTAEAAGARYAAGGWTPGAYGNPATGPVGGLGAGAAAGEAAAATPQSWGRWALQKADTLAKHDVLTGVVGPARNLVGAGTAAANRSGTGVATNLFRLSVTDAAPGFFHSVDEEVNRPGTIDRRSMAPPDASSSMVREERDQADPTEAVRRGINPNRYFGLEGWATRARQHGTLLKNTVGLGEPGEPGYGRYAAGNVGQVADVGAEALRNPEGAAGRVGAWTRNNGEHLLGGDRIPDSVPGRSPAYRADQGDTHRLLTDNYADILGSFNRDQGRPLTENNNVPAADRFDSAARSLADMTATLPTYRSPRNAGMPLAQQEVLHDRAVERLLRDPTVSANPDDVAAVRQMRQNATSMFFRPPQTADTRNLPLPFPTGADRQAALRMYGAGPAGTGSNVFERIVNGFNSGRLGEIPQNPDTAEVARNRLTTELAPVERNYRQALQTVRDGRAEARLAGLMGPGVAAPQSVPTAPAPTPVQPQGALGGGPAPTPPAANDKPDAPAAPPPPEVAKELADQGPNVAARIAELAGAPAAAGAAGMAAALDAINTVEPPPGVGDYWKSLPNASKVLVYAGLSMTAVAALRSMFGSNDEDDEPGFLMKVLPYLGLGAAGFGLGGGTLWGDTGVQMPTMANYQRLGSGVMNSLSLGGGPKVE